MNRKKQHRGGPDAVSLSNLLPDKTGELRLEVVGGDTSFAGDGVRDRGTGLGLLSRKKLKSCQCDETEVENNKKKLNIFYEGRLIKKNEYERFVNVYRRQR